MNNLNLKRNGLFICLALALLFASCSKKMAFTNSGIAPAAKGWVKIKKGNNKNYNIEVSVINLAPSENLVPAKKTYVVWMTKRDNETLNIGQLRSSTGMLSKLLKGSLKTVSPFEPARFFITAEDDGASTFPGNLYILKTF